MSERESDAKFVALVRKQAMWRFPDSLLGERPAAPGSEALNRMPEVWTPGSLARARQLYITDVMEFAEEAAQQAVEREREVCARLVECSPVHHAREKMAAAIRSRGHE